MVVAPSDDSPPAPTQHFVICLRKILHDQRIMQCLVEGMGEPRLLRFDEIEEARDIPWSLGGPHDVLDRKSVV